MITKEDQCNENIYIIKEGDANVWTKMNRDEIKRHQNNLEIFAADPNFVYSNRKFKKNI